MNLRIKQKNLMDIQAKNSVSSKEEVIRLASNFSSMKYLLILRKQKCNPKVLCTHYMTNQGMSTFFFFKSTYLLKSAKTEHIMKKCIHNLTPKIFCLSSSYFKLLLQTFILMGSSVM